MEHTNTASIVAAWIAASVAILSVGVTASLQIWLKFRESREARQHEILRYRREALHAALQVVDHVYANSPFDGKPPAQPHDWDLVLAWDAMNKMILYCDEPARTVSAFASAVGLHNPNTGPAPIYGAGRLFDLRREVCRELGLRETNYVSPDIVWIAGLPGAR